MIEDGETRFEITRDSLDDVVVWNPGPEKAAEMSDFGPKDGWKNMRMFMLQELEFSILQLCDH